MTANPRRAGLNVIHIRKVLNDLFEAGGVLNDRIKLFSILIARKFFQESGVSEDQPKGSPKLV